MSDFIKRDDAIEKINNALKRAFVEDIGQEILASVPSADVVLIVRCKDCIWQEECVITQLWGGGNGYCKSGERKDDE